MRLNLYSWIVFSCLALNVFAQGPAAGTAPITLSLDEAIRMALEKNLTIQIGRSSPQSARFNLEGSYGYYDPVFSGRAGQTYTKRTGGYNPDLGTLFPGGENWVEDFSAGIDGVLPTGTRYALDWRLVRTSGTDIRQFTVINGAVTNTITGEVDRKFEYQSAVGVSVTQPLLKDFWVDSGRLSIKVRKREIKQSELGFQLTIMEIVNSTARAYYRLIAARDQVKVREMALQLKEQFLSETKKKVQTGTLAQLDEKQAESDAATARADLIKARLDAETSENSLKALVTDDFVLLHASTVVPSEKLIAVSQSINVVESWRIGLETRPDYLRMKEELEIQNIRLKFTKNQLYPALDVTGSYGRAGLGGSTVDSLDTIADNRFPTWGGFVTLTVPFSRKTERANHKIQKVSVKTAVLELKQMEQGIVLDIDNAVKVVRSAYAAIEATREARIFAEAALEAEQKKLENGKSTNFQVLELQDRLTQARAAEINALTVYNIALHDFYLSEGTTLQRNKVELEVK